MKVKYHYIESIAKYLFIVLFLYTATSKIIEYHKFFNDLINMPIIKDRMVARIISVAVPATEIISAILLLVNSLKYIGWNLTVILMILFTAYISGLLVFADHLPCSCGGIISELNWREHLVLNIFLLLLAILARNIHIKANSI